MKTDSFYTQLKQQAEGDYPRLHSCPSPIDYTHLFSPHVLTLPKIAFVKAQAAIQAFNNLALFPPYQEAIKVADREIMKAPASNRSVLMAYDFHTSEEGDLSLIEINTNASGYLLSELLYRVHSRKAPSEAEPMQSLLDSFKQEYALCHNSKNDIHNLTIIDEAPAQQKMYLEFLMYKDFFGRQGWPTTIEDQSALRLDEKGQLINSTLKPTDLIYNRSTDFLFQDPQCSVLRQSYLKGLSCFTPHPKEYVLLADKQRLIEMSQPHWLEDLGVSSEEAKAIKEVLVPTFELNNVSDPDELWKKRKKLFFKPKRAFGGKSAYRGASITRKTFERLLQEDTLVQEFRPAQRVKTAEDGKWKFDLRFYVYQATIQLVVARTYQGQVTNFSTPGGGFTAVEFS